MRQRKVISSESRRFANFNRLLGLNHSDDDEGEEDVSDASSDEDGWTSVGRPSTLLERDLLAGLNAWLDRLYEGSLRRYPVADWPRNLTLAASD